MTVKETFESKYVVWAFGLTLTIIFSLIGFTTNSTLENINESIVGVSSDVTELKTIINNAIVRQTEHEIQIRLFEKEIKRLQEEIQELKILREKIH